MDTPDEAIKQGDKCDWEQSHRLQVPHLWFRLVHPKTEDKLLLAGGYGTKVNGHHLVVSYKVAINQWFLKYCGEWICIHAWIQGEWA